MTKSIEKFIYLSLTPLYLFMVYYKTVLGADLEGLIAVSVVTLLLYVPIQILILQGRSDFIKVYLRLIFGLIALVGLFAYLESMKVSKEIMGGFAFAVYILWWFISSKLLDIALYGDSVAQLKIFGWFFFILGLSILNTVSSLPDQMNFMYFVELILMMLYIFLVTMLLVPRVGIKVFAKIMLFILKDGLKGIFGGSKEKRQSSEETTQEDVEKFFNFIVFGIILVVIMSDVVNSFIQGMDPWWSAVGISATMIIVSAIGAHFQVNLFVSHFVQDSSKKTKITVTSLAIFYGAMMINMGLVNTIEKNSTKIQSTQKSMDTFNSSLQRKFHD